MSGEDEPPWTAKKTVLAASWVIQNLPKSAQPPDDANTSLVQPYRIHTSQGDTGQSTNSTVSLEATSGTLNEYWPNNDFLVLWAQLVGILTVAMLTLTGNIMVIVTLVSTKGHRKATNCLIISLAFADSLIGVVLPVSMISYILQYWPLGRGGCKVFLTLSHVLLDASMLATVLVSLDRWWSIQHPFKYRVCQSRQKAVLAILVAWIASCLVYVPPFVLWDHWHRPQPNVDLYVCLSPFRNNIPFAFTTGLLEFIIPTVVMISCHLSIYNKVRGRKDTNVRRSVSTSDYFSVSSSNNLSVEDIDQKTPMLSNRSPRRGSLLPGLPISVHQSPELFLSRRSHSICNQKQTRVHLPSGETVVRCNSESDSTSLAEFKQFTTRSRRVSFDASTFAEQIRRGRRQSVTNGRRNSDAIVKDMLHKQNQKAARALALLVFVLLLCWCPYVLLKMMTPFCTPLPLILYRATEWLCYMNSSLNPFLHILGNASFARRLRYVLGMSSHGPQDGFHRPSIFTQPILPGTALGARYHTATTRLVNDNPASQVIHEAQES